MLKRQHGRISHRTRNDFSWQLASCKHNRLHVLSPGQSHEKACARQYLQALLADCIDCPKPSRHWLLRAYNPHSDIGAGFPNRLQMDKASAGPRRQVYGARDIGQHASPLHSGLTYARCRSQGYPCCWTVSTLVTRVSSVCGEGAVNSQSAKY